MNVKKDIDINNFQGFIKGDLVVYEKGGDPMDGYVLYGFDEVGMFDAEFKVPQYCMMQEVA
jgi:hypothetical protein